MERILRLTTPGIEKGLVLKYRVCFSGIDQAGYCDNKGEGHDLMNGDYFQHISDDEFNSLLGTMPVDYKGAYIQIARVPFFYFCWNGDVERLVYVRFRENGWSVIEANRPELLLPYMPREFFDKDVVLGERSPHDTGHFVDNYSPLINEVQVTNGDEIYE